MIKIIKNLNSYNLVRSVLFSSTILGVSCQQNSKSRMLGTKTTTLKTILYGLFVRSSFGSEEILDHNLNPLFENTTFKNIEEFNCSDFYDQSIKLEKKDPFLDCVFEKELSPIKIENAKCYNDQNNVETLIGTIKTDNSIFQGKAVLDRSKVNSSIYLDIWNSSSLSFGHTCYKINTGYKWRISQSQLEVFTKWLRKTTKDCSIHISDPLNFDINQKFKIENFKTGIPSTYFEEENYDWDMSILELAILTRRPDILFLVIQHNGLIYNDNFYEKILLEVLKIHSHHFYPELKYFKKDQRIDWNKKLSSRKTLPSASFSAAISQWGAEDGTFYDLLEKGLFDLNCMDESGAILYHEYLKIKGKLPYYKRRRFDFESWEKLLKPKEGTIYKICGSDNQILAKNLTNCNENILQDLYLINFKIDKISTSNVKLQLEVEYLRDELNSTYNNTNDKLIKLKLEVDYLRNELKELSSYVHDNNNRDKLNEIIEKIEENNKLFNFVILANFSVVISGLVSYLIFYPETFKGILQKLKTRIQKVYQTGENNTKGKP